MQNLISKTIEFLNIKQPVRIILHTDAGKETVAAWCYFTRRGNKINYHKIDIYLPNIVSSEYCLNSVIVHELIHASQHEENQNLATYHGIDFSSKSAKVTKYLKDFGYSLPDVFNPLTDTD